MSKQVALSFFRNWYELAEMQTSDEARLAFYDSIARYAFDGVEPKKPKKDSTKAEKASYFAFLTVQPVIDAAYKKSAAAKRAIQKRWNTPYDTPYDKKEDTEENTPYDTAYVKKNIRRIPSLNNKKRIEENKNRREQQLQQQSPPTKEQFLQQAPIIGITDPEFAAKLYDDLQSVAWTGGDGKRIDNWRRYAKAAWNDYRREADAAAIAPVEGDMEIITADSL